MSSVFIVDLFADARYGRFNASSTDFGSTDRFYRRGELERELRVRDGVKPWT